MENFMIRRYGNTYFFTANKYAVSSFILAVPARSSGGLRELTNYTIRTFGNF